MVSESRLVEVKQLMMSVKCDVPLRGVKKPLFYAQRQTYSNSRVKIRRVTIKYGGKAYQVSHDKVGCVSTI